MTAEDGPCLGFGCGCGCGPQQPGRGRRRRCGQASAWLGGVGALLALGGAVLSAFWPVLFRILLQKELSISPTSTSFHIWKDPPVDIYIQFYFFNWTNPEALKEGEKPHFVEMGPYVFKEVHEKRDLQWNSNHTVTYWRARHWFFDESRSNGSLSDEVVTINIIALTAAYCARDWSYFLKASMSLGMKSLGTQLYEAHTVGEFLFEGHDSPLITMAKSMPDVANINIPFDRFGWFYERNGSMSWDGQFTMHTGADDLALLGHLSRWNGRTRTDFYPGTCGLVNGSAGELWPPGRTREEKLAMYSPDLCRSISFDYEGDSEVQGVSTYRYSLGAPLLDNSEECFCGGVCAPAGSLNVSSCRFGAPGFLSYPHYYLADPSYLQAVTGMRPDRERHASYISIEPSTGITMDVYIKFQINLLLQSYPPITLLDDIPTIYFPIMWFEERVTIPLDIARSLKLLLLMESGGRIVGIIFAVTGVLMMAVAAFYWTRSSHRWRQHNFQNTTIAMKPLAPKNLKYTKGDAEVDSELLQHLSQKSDG